MEILRQTPRDCAEIIPSTWGTDWGTANQDTPENPNKSRFSPCQMVRSRRLELPRELPHSDLNAARLPIPPRPHCLGLVARCIAWDSGDVKGVSAGSAKNPLLGPHVAARGARRTM